MLRTTTFGAGDVPVLLFNDWFGDHRTYDPARPYLDTARFRWVFCDLRGYGLNREVPGEHTLEEAAADMVAVLESLGGAHLVGHSMSSLVAQQVAVDRPDLVRSLVLVCPVPPQGMGAPEPVIAWLEGVARDVGSREAALGARMAARYGLGWARFKLDRWADAADPEAVAAYVRTYATRTVNGAAPDGLAVSTIVGDRDDEPFTPATVRAKVGTFWPDVRIEVCESAGHYPMQETPAAFARLLAEALGR
ncbi:MAG: alpha/beta hydrolase [Myxococcota bacterium]